MFVSSFIHSLALFYFSSYILMRLTHYVAAYSFYCRHPSGLILQTSRWFHPCWWQGSNYLWNWSFFWKGKTLKCISVHLLFTHVNYALAHHTVYMYMYVPIPGHFLHLFQELTSVRWERADTLLVYNSFHLLTCPKDWMVDCQRFLSNFEKYTRGLVAFYQTGSSYSQTTVHRWLILFIMLIYVSLKKNEVILKVNNPFSWLKKHFKVSFGESILKYLL